MSGFMNLSSDSVFLRSHLRTKKREKIMDMEREDFAERWFDADLDSDFESCELHDDATEL